MLLRNGKSTHNTTVYMRNMSTEIRSPPNTIYSYEQKNVGTVNLTYLSPGLSTDYDTFQYSVYFFR